MKHILMGLLIAFSLGSAAKTTPQTPPSEAEQPFDAIDIANVYKLLHQNQLTLSQDVLRTIEAVVHCANKNKTAHNQTLTVIDYSKPSTEKRLWVLDLKHNKVFNTYVSHGLNSGRLDTTFFSNKNKSKATSLGVFQTKNSYNGRYGLAVRLTGLEKSFNDNAYDRALVIHPAWYVSEDFIQKYGRLGRSWGCPAVPYNMIKQVINTIKNQTLLVIYYPENQWLDKSTFLNCDNLAVNQQIDHIAQRSISATEQQRAQVLYLDNNNNNQHDDAEAVVAMRADHYQRVYQVKPPLSRMLRRQVQGYEYIALTPDEFKQLDSNQDKKLSLEDKLGFHLIDLMAAQVTKVDWYWATEFTPLKMDKSNSLDLDNPTVLIDSEKKRFEIKSTDAFIRWLGL